MAFLVFIHIVVLINLSLIINNFTSAKLMNAYDSNGTVFPNGIGVVSPGQNITMKCLHPDKIKWTRTSVEHPEKSQRLSSNDRIKIANNILEIHNIQFEDAMVYYCERYGINYKFFLNVYAITDAKNGTVETSKYTFEMNGVKFDYWKINEKSRPNASCTCDSGSSKVEFEITWEGRLYKNKVYDEYSTSSVVNNTAKTSTLYITKPRNNEELYGQFSCFCNAATRSKKEEKVYINVIPIFDEHESSVRSTEGLNITLTCVVWAYPPITQPIKWRFQNSGLLRSGIEVTQTLSTMSVSTLFIPLATQDDRGVYTCHAQNDIGSNTSGYMVRVKGRYAALWPFIGIVIQVIILAAIIIAYELKKSHKPQENSKFNYESKNEQEPGVAVRGGEATDIRQRLMVN